jgi:predicted CoA-binding protein
MGNLTEEMREFLAFHTFAIVGASTNRAKYGNIVLRNLRDKGFEVLPVNPHEVEIEGEVAYKNLSSLPKDVDGIVTIVPPRVTEQIVRDAKAAGIKRVWMQEGSESEDALRYCRDNRMTAITGACIMVMTSGVKRAAHRR